MPSCGVRLAVLGVISTYAKMKVCRLHLMAVIASIINDSVDYSDTFLSFFPLHLHISIPALPGLDFRLF